MQEEEGAHYIADRVLLLGLIHCEHPGGFESCERNFWGIINPYVKETVEPKTVEQFLLLLATIAIKLPKKYFEFRVEYEQKINHNLETNDNLRFIQEIVDYLDETW